MATIARKFTKLGYVTKYFTTPINKEIQLYLIGVYEKMQKLEEIAALFNACQQYTTENGPTEDKIPKSTAAPGSN